MRTIAIIGTDWEGADPNWIRQPFTDGGRLQFDRRRLEDWDNVFYELHELAGLPTLAVGIRGIYDTGSVQSLPVAKEAYLSRPSRPTLLPWFDTVGLPDIAGPPGMAHPFDFGNPDHIRWGWERFASTFFHAFGDLPLERTANGKLLVGWWGIETPTGHGFRNQHLAQRLLDYVDSQLIIFGLGPADHLVDQSWAALVPDLRAHAVHDWFNPWGSIPRPWSTRTYRGVTTGVVVPSFYHRIEPLDGETLRQGLSVCRDAGAHYVLIEGGTNFQEAAELMRDSTGDARKLNVVLQHIQLTTPVPPEVPVSAVSQTPLFLFNHAAVIPLSNGQKALRWNQTTQQVDAGSSRVFSLQPNGTIQDRPDTAIGAWESGTVEGDRLIFRVEQARAVFAWQD